jgi:SAM-dependent methyltransferase
MNYRTSHPVAIQHVPETAFGKVFLRSGIWTEHVLERALKDLDRLLPPQRRVFPVVVDVGCGWGRSLPKLQKRFAPTRLIGIDVDHEMIDASAREADDRGLEVELICGNSSAMPLVDASVDLLFCHQTFHHLVDQDSAISEFYRVLKPGGLLLFAESTRCYIESWLIMALFRHPMDVQRTAPEYLAMIIGAGFEVRPEAVSYPFLWWSRPDLGVMERWFGVAPPLAREETLINLVAIKPLG